MLGTLDKKLKKGFTIMSNYKIFFVLLLFIIIDSCSKSNTSNTNEFFPPVAVRIDINTSLPYYSALTMQQGWVYEQGGNKGIIIYNSPLNGIVAFDRTCPINPTLECAFVSMDSSNTFFKCSQYANSGKKCTNAGFCTTTFFPDNGYPRSYPTALNNFPILPLKSYRVTTDAPGVYHISN